MKRLVSILGLVASWPLGAAWAQLVAPNETGVTMGQWHTIVRDVEATKKFWMTLGGMPIKVDGTDVMKFPGVLVFLTPGSPAGGSEASIASHVGLYVPNAKESLTKWKGMGLKVEFEGAFVFSPDDLKMDIHDYKEVPEDLKISLRGDQPLTAPISGSHVHFFIGESSQKQMQAWYVKTFGGVAGNTINGVRIGGIPGVSMSVGRAPNSRMGASATPLPTKGRALDSIGFEITNLKEFCKKLEAGGMKFDQPYSKTRHKSFADAELTDPWGTSIQLTEGLSRF